MTGNTPTGYPDLPKNASTPQIVEHVNRLRDGHLNTSNTVTLATGTTQTVVTNVHIGIRSIPLFTPVTAHAAAELAAGTLTVATTNIGKGTLTITHSSNSQADRTFLVCIVG